MMRLRPRPARRGDVPRGAADRPSCRRHVSALGPVQSCLNHPPRGSRMSVEMSSGSNRSALEVTAAVRTPTTQAHLDALRAPSALEGADHRLRRLGRQVDVAAFAARAQLQHAASLPAIVEGHSRWERYARTSPCADAKSLVAAWERCLAAAVAVADHLVEREPVRQPLRHVAWIHLVQGHPDPPRGLRREADGPPGDDRLDRLPWHATHDHLGPPHRLRLGHCRRTANNISGDNVGQRDRSSHNRPAGRSSSFGIRQPGGGRNFPPRATSAAKPPRWAEAAIPPRRRAVSGHPTGHQSRNPSCTAAASQRRVCVDGRADHDGEPPRGRGAHLPDARPSR